MGFLKNLKNNLTGSWADVTLQSSEGTRGGTVQAVVDVTVKDADIAVDAVVLEISCEEIVTIPAQYRRSDAQGSSDYRDGEITSTLHSHSVPLSGVVQLTAGSHQRYEGTIPVPAHLPSTFDGRNARVQWSVRGRLDMKGNDPDSGWVTLIVT